MSASEGLPDEVEVVVEVPRGSLAKRRPDGRIAFVSPMPSPFNYGSIPAIQAEDGDPLDAIVLGPRLPYGSRVRVSVHAVVRFRDAGHVDDKVVCGRAPSARDRRLVLAFFRLYAGVKRLANAARGRRGVTALLGWDGLGR